MTSISHFELAEKSHMSKYTIMSLFVRPLDRLEVTTLVEKFYFSNFNCIRFREISTSSTFTITCCCKLTCALTSLTYPSARFEMCIRPLSLIPISTKAPKAVTLFTMPGNNCPGCTSSIVLIF